MTPSTIANTAAWLPFRAHTRPDLAGVIVSRYATRNEDAKMGASSQISCCNSNQLVVMDDFRIVEFPSSTCVVFFLIGHQSETFRTRPAA